MFKDLVDGMSFSGVANGEIVLIDPPEGTLIEWYSVTVDGTEIKREDALNSPGPVYFSFYTDLISNGDHDLGVYASLTGPDFIDVTAQIQIYNAPPTLNVNITQDGVQVPVKNGTIFTGDVDGVVTVLKSGTVVPISHATVRLGDVTLLDLEAPAGGLPNIYFHFGAVDFQDGTYTLVVTVTTIYGTHLTSTATVVVQNRNPVLLILGIACFAIAALTYITQVQRAKRRATVAITLAATTPQKSTKPKITSRGAPTPTAPTPAPCPGPGWKATVSLVALVAIIGWDVVWLALANPAAVDALFGVAFAYQLLLVGSGIAASLALLSLLLLRHPAGRTIASIVYTATMLGSILALGLLLVQLFGGNLAPIVRGQWPEDIIILGTLLAVEGGLLGWLVAPPPAAVLAARFARWRPPPSPVQGVPLLPVPQRPVIGPTVGQPSSKLPK